MSFLRNRRPCEAPCHSILAARRTSRIAILPARVILLSVPVVRPLPNIPQHVVELPLIRRFSRHGVLEIPVLKQALRVIALVVTPQSCAVDVLAPAVVPIPCDVVEISIGRRGTARAGGVLPFCVGWQPHPRPATEFLGLVPVHKHRWRIVGGSLVQLPALVIGRCQRFFTSSCPKTLPGAHRCRGLAHPESFCDGDRVCRLFVGFAVTVARRASHGECPW